MSRRLALLAALLAGTAQAAQAVAHGEAHEHATAHGAHHSHLAPQVVEPGDAHDDHPHALLDQGLKSRGEATPSLPAPVPAMTLAVTRAVAEPVLRDPGAVQTERSRRRVAGPRAPPRF